MEKAKHQIGSVMMFTNILFRQEQMRFDQFPDGWVVVMDHVMDHVTRQGQEWGYKVQYVDPELDWVNGGSFGVGHSELPAVE